VRVFIFVLGEGLGGREGRGVLLWFDFLKGNDDDGDDSILSVL